MIAPQHRACQTNSGGYRDHHTAIAEGRPSPITNQPPPPPPPALWRKAANFASAVLAQTPLIAKALLTGDEAQAFRSPEEIEEIAEICRGCSLFNGDVCTHKNCGCQISADRNVWLSKLAWRSQTCPDNPPKWGGAQAIAPAAAPFALPDLAVFVLGHRRGQLAVVGDAPHVRKVYLSEISFSERRLAEFRFYLAADIFRCGAEYIGMASASWNRKYGGEMWLGRVWPHCLPIERLNELALSPSVVWAAAPTTVDPATGANWSDGMDFMFRGIDSLVRSVAAHFGLRHLRRPSVLANNFIAHRDVTRALARFMRSAIAWLDSKYGPVWPIRPYAHFVHFNNRLPAFMGEALALLWFANQTDLEIRQIPSP